MVRGPKASPLLFGFRGTPPIDIDALEDLVGRIAAMKHDLPQLQRLSLPLIHASEDGVHVLSASGSVAPVADARTAEFVRRMHDDA